ncbi:hypothetical protein [Niabella ginsengisoli]|uniref:Uncharacterized protein n=1 Tax=Niabella ginsengisoli TaxID=522298 RepID=A0ABS9SL45_9BACT|nr:hypothetical protein [Niabella ginsengisoli]MCH5599088.1 hypothetical protein [Niabella ginsengisoli]
MDAIRKIIEKHSNPLTIVLPDEYKDKKVEVIVMALEEEKPKNDLSAFLVS